MVKVKFVGMMVGILFLMNVLRDYYCVAHQDHFLGLQHSDAGTGRWSNHDNKYPMVAACSVDHQVTPEKNHKELGGRKMVVRKKMKKNNKVVGPGASGAATDDEDHNTNSAAYHKKLRYLKQAFPAARNLKVDADTGSTTKTGPEGDSDDQRLLEATRKIVALMHRDYKGMNKPKRKPPINNHLPIH